MKKIFTLLTAALCSVAAFAADGFHLTYKDQTITSDTELNIGYREAVPGKIYDWQPEIFAVASSDMTASVSFTSTETTDVTKLQLCIGGQCQALSGSGAVISQEVALKANEPVNVAGHRGALVAAQAATAKDLKATLTVANKANPSDKIVLVLNFVVKPDSEMGGVGSIEADNQGPVTYYNILGMQLREEPESGIFIRRQGNKAVKVIK